MISEVKKLQANPNETSNFISQLEMVIKELKSDLEKS